MYHSIIVTYETYDSQDDDVVEKNLSKAITKSLSECNVIQIKDHETAKNDSISDKYNELLMAVSDKIEGQTRHETALNSIKFAEKIRVAGKTELLPSITNEKGKQCPRCHIGTLKDGYCEACSFNLNDYVE